MSDFATVFGGYDPAALKERALTLLCDSYAPELWRLSYNPRLPDRHLAAILDWADDLGSADPSCAFDLGVLVEVLPAISAAVLASYSFAAAPAPNMPMGRARVDLELNDRGDAYLLEMTRACTSILAAIYQGEAGEALVNSECDKFNATLDAISAAIAKQGPATP